MNNATYNKIEFNETIMELHDDESFNPYLILNISTEYTEQKLKEQYKYYALKTHPDKGGNPEHFALVSKSYIYLLKVLKHNIPTKNLTEIKEEFNDYITDQNMNQKQNIKLENKFDLEKFNDVFKEYRINSEVDRGYGDFLKERGDENIPHNNEISSDNFLKEREEINIPKNNEIFSDNFNVSLFNKMFKTQTSNDKKNRQLMKIETPEEMQYNNGYELGVCDISDFSKSCSLEGNSGLDYTDIKVAYTTDRLVDETQVKMPEWESLEQLQKERSNISFDLSDRNRVLIEQQQQFKQQEEYDRVNNLKLNDIETNKQFNKIHKLMINK